MTTNLAKWAPNNGQIIKSGLSDGRRAKFLPSVAGYDYYWLRTGGYLGNVGLKLLNEALGHASISARVVVVDDGSSFPADEIALIYQGLDAISQVTAITLTRNMGNQRAIAIGLGYVAKEMPCDYLVIMDSDMEDLPEYVPQLVERAAESNSKIIFAERTRRANRMTLAYPVNAHDRYM